MINKIKEIFNDADLRTRILFTLIMLFIFRVGANIPVPGIDRNILSQVYGDSNGVFDIYNLLSAGSLQDLTFFSLGITPYITASIIVQLLGVLIPSIEELRKDGDIGKKKIERMTMIGGVTLALIQSFGITFGFFRQAVIGSVWKGIIAALLLSLGALILMGIGHLIDEKGIGNGMSLLIFTGIVSRIPQDMLGLYSKKDNIGIIGIVLLFVLILLAVLGIVYIQQGVRKIPVQYSARVEGLKKYKGNRTYIPIKVNQGGVVPVIFALTIVQAPLTIGYLFPRSSYYDFILKWFSPYNAPGIYIYIAIYLMLIVFFTFFYSDMAFNPVDTAVQLKNNGGIIPGIKPGTQTVEKLKTVTMEVEKVGAIFLCIIAVIPLLLSHYAGISLSLGGTSALITVGVAIELMQTIDNKLLLRRELGFLR